MFNDLKSNFDIWNRRNVSGKVETREIDGPPYQGEYPRTTPWKTIQVQDGLDVSDLVPAKKVYQAARALTVSATQVRTVVTGDIQDFNIYEYDAVFDFINGKEVNIERKFGTKTFVRRESVNLEKNVRQSIETRTCFVVLGC